MADIENEHWGEHKIQGAVGELMARCNLSIVALLV
jgi:hypothetical protein